MNLFAMDGHSLDGLAMAGVLFGLIGLAYLIIGAIAITAAIYLIAQVARFSGRLLAATWKRLTGTRGLQ